MKKVTLIMVTALVLVSLVATVSISSYLVKSSSFCSLKEDNPDLIPYLGSQLQRDIFENNPEVAKEFTNFYTSPLGKVILKNQIKEYSRCMKNGK